MSFSQCELRLPVGCSHQGWPMVRLALAASSAARLHIAGRDGRNRAERGGTSVEYRPSLPEPQGSRASRNRGFSHRQRLVWFVFLCHPLSSSSSSFPSLTFTLLTLFEASNSLAVSENRSLFPSCAVSRTSPCPQLQSRPNNCFSFKAVLHFSPLYCPPRAFARASLFLWRREGHCLGVALKGCTTPLRGF